MDFDCLSKIKSISRLHGNQQWDNICAFVHILIFFFAQASGGRSNLTYFPINNQDPSKILEMLELKVHWKKSEI